MKRRVFTAHRCAPLAEEVAAALARSPAEAAALIARGAVYVQGRRCQAPARELKVGEVVTVVLEESGRSVLEPTPAPPLVVLLEDEVLLAVDKPPGVHAQPTAGRVGHSLLDLASAHLGRPAGLVHRLDRDTSGVTLFGKTSKATAALAEQFRVGRVTKRYLAITAEGIAERATIDLPIAKDPSRPGRYRAARSGGGKSAHTELRRLEQFGPHALVELFPRTGRTHQLRAHLCALGFPIVGDRLYGGSSEASRCLLHAAAVSFFHPTTGASVTVEAPLPEDMARLRR